MRLTKYLLQSKQKMKILSFDKQELEQKTEALKAIAHPMRMSILQYILNNGELCVSQLAELLRGLPKDKIIYTHCKAGGRALVCGDILKKQGYDVRPLKPGYEALIQAGFEKAAPQP